MTLPEGVSRASTGVKSGMIFYIREIFLETDSRQNKQLEPAEHCEEVHCNDGDTMLLSALTSAFSGVMEK